MLQYTIMSTEKTLYCIRHCTLNCTLQCLYTVLHCTLCWTLPYTVVFHQVHISADLGFRSDSYLLTLWCPVIESSGHSGSGDIRFCFVFYLQLLVKVLVLVLVCLFHLMFCLCVSLFTNPLALMHLMRSA